MMRTRRRFALAVSFALSAVVLSAQGPATAADADLHGKLYKSVFSAGAGTLAAPDVAAAPEPLRERLTKYLARRAAFKSSYKSQADSFDSVRVDAKRRLLEQAIVALIEAPGIERTAADYVASAPINYEWKGMPEGPLEEANHAEALLKKDPSSPLAPWFYVFIAHRQRAAFEAAEGQKNQDGMKAAAKKYRAFAERARAVPDAIFPALLADMERQPYVYLKTTAHPRDYNPDA